MDLLLLLHLVDIQVRNSSIVSVDDLGEFL